MRFLVSVPWARGSGSFGKNLFALISILLSLVGSRVTLAKSLTLVCVDCYSSASFYPLRAQQLAPFGVEVRWIFLQTHDYDSAYQRHLQAFPAGTPILRWNPSDPVATQGLVDYLRAEQVAGVLGGMDEGTYHACELNARMGLVDDDLMTRHLRREKLAMGEAAGEWGIPAQKLTDVDKAMQFIQRLDQKEIVLKYNAGVGGFKMEFLNTQNPVSLRDHLSERMRTNQSGAFGKQDDLLIQPRIQGREFFVNTYSVDGRTYLTGLSEYFRIVWGDRSLYFINTFLSLNSAEGKLLGPVAAEVNRRLGRRNGPAHVEFIIEDATGRIYLLENNVRVAGAGVPELERSVYGISHLDLHLLRILDPKRFYAELQKLPRDMVNPASMMLIPSPSDGRFSQQAVDWIKNLPTFFKMPSHFGLMPSVVKPTTDLRSSAATLHFKGNWSEMRSDAEKIIGALRVGSLIEFSAQTSSCSGQLESAALFQVLQTGLEQVQWTPGKPPGT